MRASSKKYQYSICWSGKSGCTSLRRLFLFLHQNEIEEEVEYGDISLFFRFNDLYKKMMMIARNPFARLASAFTNKMCGGEHHSVLAEKIPQFSEKVSFRNFIYFLDKNRHDLFHIDPHLWLQTDSLILNRADSIYFPLDKVKLVKLENFNSNILEAYDEFGLHDLIPKVKDFLDDLNQKQICKNATPRCDSNEFVGDQDYSPQQRIFPNYKFFYDDELIDLVYDIYKKDFTDLGYDKTL